MIRREGEYMDAVHTETFTVRLNEINHLGTAKISAIFNFFQNTSSDQSAILGFPITELIKKNLTWVVSRYHLKIFRMPLWKEAVIVRTWRSAQKGFFAPREFEILDTEGKTVVLATSSFVLLDMTSKKPVSPKEHFPEYPIGEKRAISDDFSSLPELTETDLEMTFTVRRHDLDVNRHVNNALYIEWAMENVPDTVFDEYVPSEIEVSFRAEAFSGDSVVSKTQMLNQNSSASFLHKLVREKDGKELTRLKTTWVKNNGENRGRM